MKKRFSETFVSSRKEKKINISLKNKKAISTVVSTLLILLLVFVAVGVLWVVISNVIQEGTEQVSLGKFTLSLNIQEVEVLEDSLNVRVKRNAGAGEFTGISFIVDDGSNTEVFEEYNVTMNEHAVRTFPVPLDEIDANNIQRVGIAPIFTLESGKDVTGDVKDEFEISSGSSGDTGDNGDTGDGAVCGNGANETGEECDDDDLQNGDGCSSSCTIESGWTCSGGSGNSTCEEISTEDCGDGFVQSENNEQCDEGDANNGVECTASYGSSCTYCSLSCQNETVQGPYCGDGLIQSSEGEECDDGDQEGGDGCSSSCTVESGWTCDTNEPSGCTEDSGSGTSSFPVVESITETSFPSSTTAHNVDMPASGINSGNLLIILFSTQGRSSITTPSGWIELARGPGGNSAELGVYVRVSDGTEEGGSVNIETGLSRQAAAQVYMISNWNGSISGIENSSVSSDAGTTPNPPSLSPSWGSEKNLWIAVSGSGPGAANVTAYPDNYVNGIYTVSSDSEGSTTASAVREFESSTDDPGAFSLSEVEEYATVTLAVRPSA